MTWSGQILNLCQQMCFNCGLCRMFDLNWLFMVIDTLNFHVYFNNLSKHGILPRTNHLWMSTCVFMSQSMLTLSQAWLLLWKHYIISMYRTAVLPIQVWLQLPCVHMLSRVICLVMSVCVHAYVHMDCYCIAIQPHLVNLAATYVALHR